MSTAISLGLSDFREMRAHGIFYADKSHLIRDLLDVPNPAVLFTRPRRFGKSAALSLLRAYFERSAEDLTPLFHDLLIWQAGDSYRAHFQRYPVIHLSFKEAKAATWAECEKAVVAELSRAAAEHRYLLESGVIYEDEALRLRALLAREVSGADAWATLRDLCKCLRRHHQERVLVLIDEYDTPILAGHQRGFFDEVCLFFRNLFSALLKDNPHLFRGVLTGILRVAKEDLFSGPNNVISYDVLHPRFATAFGFTEAEVQDLLVRIGHAAALPEVQAWYNGYLMGGQVIYNPWSVLSFAQQPERGCLPYWVHTGSDDVLRAQVLNLPYVVVDEIRDLLGDTVITKEVDPHLTLRDLEQEKGAVWSLLLHAGYLKACALRNEEGRLMADLRIPNLEVRTVYRKGILRWLGSGEEAEGSLDQLQQALLGGDTATFAARLAELAQRVLSFHDTAGREPEKVYQAFALGVLTRLLSRYDVDSNREGGLGRYDILVAPRTRGEPGAVLEFKVARDASARAVAAALTEGLAQIKRKGYAAQLQQRGAAPIWCYAVACFGKQVFVRRQGERSSYPRSAARA